MNSVISRLLDLRLLDLRLLDILEWGVIGIAVRGQLASACHGGKWGLKSVRKRSTRLNFEFNERIPFQCCRSVSAGPWRDCRLWCHSSEFINCPLDALIPVIQARVALLGSRGTFRLWDRAENSVPMSLAHGCFSMWMNDSEANPPPTVGSNSSAVSPSVGRQLQAKPSPGCRQGLKPGNQNASSPTPDIPLVLPGGCSLANVRGAAPIRGDGRRLRVAGGERNPATMAWPPTQRPTILKVGTLC